MLEESSLFKRGIISVERVIDDNGTETKKKTKELKNIEGVNTAKEAIDIVLNTWAVKVTTGKQARDVANKQGYDFPNL